MNVQCSQYRDVLPDLLSGTLTLEREAEVHRHLRTCSECRALFQALQADDALLARFTEALGPTVTGIEAAVMEALAGEGQELDPEEQSVGIRSLWGKRVGYVAAAVIVFGLMMLAGRALLPLSAPTVSLAQTLEAMRSRPWIHVVQTSALEEGQRREYWEHFGARIRARKMPDGKIVYANYAENVSYAYDPDANTITVTSGWESAMADSAWNPIEQLTEAIGRIEATAAGLSQSTVVEDGARLERIRIVDDNAPGARSVVYIRDVERNLLVRVETVVLSGGQEEQSTAVFDYPGQGPEDIYALGAPRNAAVLDSRQTASDVGDEVVTQAAIAPAIVEPNAPTVSEETASLEPNAVPAEASEPVAVDSSGRVTDEQGAPIGGATVLLYHHCSQYGLGNRVVEQTQTGPQGHYVLASAIEFEKTQSHAYAQDSYVLIAMHPGYAFAWRSIAQGQEDHRFDLTLTAPTSRSITVTDHEGNPLGGTRVWLYSAGDRKSVNPLFRDYLSVPTDIGLLGAETDENGVAVITGLPKTGCSFHATLAGYAEGLAFPGQNRIRLSPGATLSGWVLTESDEPVGGAVVRLQTEWMWDFYYARSDDEGYFALVDVPAQGWDMGPWGNSEGANGQYTMTIKHDHYVGEDRTLQLLPGATIDDMVIRVSSQSTLVRCLVLEEGTDEPVAGARIQGDNEIGRINGYSDANGVFTVRVLPGPTSLTFQSPPDGVYVDRPVHSRDRHVSFEATQEEMEVVLRSPRIEGPLVSVSGVVLGPEGAPLADVAVYADAGDFHTATASSYIRPTGADANGRFTLKEIPAGRDLCLYAETKDHRYAVTEVVPVPVDVNASAPLELVLKPTESAVVALEDEDGNPVSDRSIEIQPVVGGERIWPAYRRVKTNSLGVLDVDGIVPGLTYFLRDARLDDMAGRYPEGWKKWFKGEMVLLPLEP